MSIELKEDETGLPTGQGQVNKTAVVNVSEDQQSLAIGKGGQNRSPRGQTHWLEKLIFSQRRAKNSLLPKQKQSIRKPSNLRVLGQKLDQNVF